MHFHEAFDAMVHENVMISREYWLHDLPTYLYFPPMYDCINGPYLEDKNNKIIIEKSTVSDHWKYWETDHAELLWEYDWLIFTEEDLDAANRYRKILETKHPFIYMQMMECYKGLGFFESPAPYLKQAWDYLQGILSEWEEL